MGIPIYGGVGIKKTNNRDQQWSTNHPGNLHSKKGGCGPFQEKMGSPWRFRARCGGLHRRDTFWDPRCRPRNRRSDYHREGNTRCRTVPFHAGWPAAWNFHTTALKRWPWYRGFWLDESDEEDQQTKKCSLGRRIKTRILPRVAIFQVKRAELEAKEGQESKYLLALSGVMQADSLLMIMAIEETKENPIDKMSLDQYIPWLGVRFILVLTINVTRLSPTTIVSVKYHNSIIVFVGQIWFCAKYILFSMHQISEFEVPWLWLFTSMTPTRTSPKLWIWGKLGKLGEHNFDH